jgi:hypothetical protein
MRYLFWSTGLPARSSHYLLSVAVGLGDADHAGELCQGDIFLAPDTLHVKNIVRW